MKRKIIALSLALITAFSLAACQKTPEQEFVAKKDTDRLIEQAGMSDDKASTEALNIPESYICESSALNGKLNISTDAEITLPGAASLPIARVSVDVFTQEQVTKVFHYFYPDAKPKQYAGQAETKAQIGESMKALMLSRENGTYPGTQEEYDAELENLQKRFAAAPDSDTEGSISDGTMQQRTGNAGSTHNELWVYDDASSFHVITYPAEDISATSTLRYTSENRARQYREGKNLSYSLSEQGMTEETRKSLTVSYDDALSRCWDFLELFGCSKKDFSVNKTLIVQDTDTNLNPGGHYAYRIYFSRLINDVPVYYPGFGSSDNADGYAFSWAHEALYFDVDNAGIANVEWDSPIKVNEIAEDNASLMPFEDISNICANMLSMNYAPVVQDAFEGKVTLDIEITDVELAILRIREQGGAQTEGLIVPIWVFRGVNKGTDENGEVRYLGSASSIFALQDRFAAGEIAAEGYARGNMNKMEQFYHYYPAEPALQNLLVINAVDGSIIDLDKGY